MAQSLLIGLGGTGSRVVNNVVKELHINNKTINNGEMFCAVLDSNVSDNTLIQGSGTGVPVIPTSKAKKIRNYFEDYSHLHMETWCPQSPVFQEENMLDGCSELRVKSRVALMDCLESGAIDELEMMINDVLKNNPKSEIRIMIVSSLSGGTGSGMFIQIALWLRKILRDSTITIRGIFLLPDVFVSTIGDIRKNKSTMVRHYCNAYAAIRELNTITKIMNTNSAALSEKIALDGLFDSVQDADVGDPVYDFAFFVDDKDENGVRLESIAEYEKMVAQLVYMQLYAPMTTSMYSEEDNAFLPFVKSDEPLYGSCGTAKAVYPARSVKLYCALRAAQDSLTSGWEKIDSEIKALIEEKKRAEKDGIFASEELNVRELFLKIFDEKTAIKAEEVAKDRFFYTISKEVKNETRKKEGDKIVVGYSDKATDFVKLLDSQKIDVAVTRNSRASDFALEADAFVAADHSKEDLLAQIENDTNGLKDALDAFDNNVEDYANEIVNSVFPYSMGDVKPENRCTIFGLLTKSNNRGTWDFIHPVAARYVLYKLVKELESGINKIVLADSRSEALSGGDVGTHFDNKATTKTEIEAVELLNSKQWFQNEAKFFDDFEKRYAEFITTKIELCEKYEKKSLQIAVYRKLIERVNGLIKQMESFFAGLNEVQQKLGTELAKNVAETEGISGRTMYVLSSHEDKEFIYKTLDFELDKANVSINKSVINTIYGSLCAKVRPSNIANAEYANASVNALFVREIVRAFTEKIDEDADNNSKVNMDIYTALCKASDADFKKNGGVVKESGGLENLDVVTGQISQNNEAEQRHKSTFRNCKNKLLELAAPFLKRDKELSKDEFGTVTTFTKTFWGFSPDLVTAFPSVGAELGINADLQADEAYPKSELYCYRSVYGLSATYIPKFNELKDGMYYKCYSSVISSMIQDAEGKQGERAYVRTPHLDKNWHRILPYITEEKQNQVELEFFKGLWLAIAYGKIKTDKDGCVYISRAVDTGYGNFVNTNIAITYRDMPVTKTDVIQLIEALKADKVFTDLEIPELNQRFARELETMVTYVGTDVLKGLTVKKEDLNPINVVSRYNEKPGHNSRTSAMLVGALEAIAGELAKRYSLERSKEKLEEAKFRICRKIYDSSTRTQGKSVIFQNWEAAFEKYKIKEESIGGASSK